MNISVVARCFQDIDISYLGSRVHETKVESFSRRGAFHHLFEVPAIRPITLTLSEVAGVFAVRILVIASI